MRLYFALESHALICLIPVSQPYLTEPIDAVRVSVAMWLAELFWSEEGADMDKWLYNLIWILCVHLMLGVITFPFIFRERKFASMNNIKFNFLIKKMLGGLGAGRRG